MNNFGEIKWEIQETRTLYDEIDSIQGADSFEFFLNYCRARLPSCDLIQSYQLFREEKHRLSLEVKKSIEVIAEQPFLAAFLVWIKEIILDPPDRLIARTLLEHGFMGITGKDGQIWTIANARLFDHRHVIEAIRCHRQWHFPFKEKLVKTYLGFMQWLCSITCGYIQKMEDPDLWRSRSRSLAYLNFISFLSHLKDEDQLIAKLLYFGGSRTLEEILSLNIENVDFIHYYINFGLQSINYPLHVFADIKYLLQDREKGRVFIGRRGNAAVLNPTTIFRNFKDAAMQTGLGKDFTPKLLTTNV